MDTIDTTLVAAVIAACAALAASVLGVLSAARVHRVERRKHVWQRLTWAAESRLGYDIRRTVLEGLLLVPWVEREDRRVVGAMLRWMKED